MFRSDMNLRMLIACMLSMMLLFCTSAQAYQYADDIRFAAGSGVVVDDDDSDLDSDHFHITLTPPPQLFKLPLKYLSPLDVL